MTWHTNETKPPENTTIVAWLNHSNSPHVFLTQHNNALVSLYKYPSTPNYMTSWSNVLFWFPLPNLPDFSAATNQPKSTEE